MTSEPYEWEHAQKQEEYIVVLTKVPNKRLQRMALEMRKHQFPDKCALVKILAAKDAGRFWGSMANAWHNLLGSALSSVTTHIVAPFFYGEAWMANDHKFCKDQQGSNMFLCYFLPMTNCSIPLTHRRKIMTEKTDDAVFIQAVPPKPYEKPNSLYYNGTEDLPPNAWMQQNYMDVTNSTGRRNSFCETKKGRERESDKEGQIEMISVDCVFGAHRTGF